MLCRFTLAVLTIVLTATAQDVRNLGMGRLSALIESDVHRIDLYDFGENPAGLMSATRPARKPTQQQEGFGSFTPMWGPGTDVADYSISEIFVSGWGMHNPDDDSLLFPVWAIGQPLPRDFQDLVPLGALGYHGEQPFPSRPAGGYVRTNDGSSATSARACWSHYEGESEPTVNLPELAFEGASDLGTVDIGYRAVAFYGMAANRWGQAQYLGAEAGAGVVVPGKLLSGGVCADYYHPVYHVSGDRVHDTTYHSNAARARGVLILQPLDTLKLGLKAGYTWSDIMGTTTLAPSAGVRALYEPAGVPLAVGIEAAWMNSTPYHDGEAGTTQDSLYLGGGLGLRLPFLFLGAEVQRTAWGRSYKGEDRSETTDLSLNAGAEANLGPAHVRVGFAHSTHEHYGHSDTTLCYTGGLGFSLATLWIDAAYNLLHHKRTNIYQDIIQVSVKFAGN